METSNIIGLIALVVAILTFLITLIKERKVITPIIRVFRGKLTKTSKSNETSSTRRNLLFIIGAIASLGAYAVYKRNGEMEPHRPLNKDEADISFTTKTLTKDIVDNHKHTEIISNDLVINLKSGIVHHKNECKDHLPANYEQLNSSDLTRIHAGKRVKITEKLISSLPDNQAEALLIEAIKLSPTTTHLYKYLVKMWGRKMEYSKTHEFLGVNIKYLSAKLASTNNQKEMKRFTKAIGELNNRQIKAEYLAGIARFG